MLVRWNKHPKMALVNAFFPRESPTRLLHLRQMFEDLFMNLLRILSRCFSNCCFCVGSKGESVHKPFKSGLSILHSLPGLLGISPVGFQRQMFWGSSLRSRSWGLEFLKWGTNLSFMRAEFYTVEISPNYGSVLVSREVWGGQDHISASPSGLNVALYPRL